MPILYETPADVGADRIVNGIAAYEKYGRAAGCALVVVDFGTATTLDAISAKGEYLGGAICPGRARFRPTRCFSARRGCRASTCASRRPSSAARPSARWSPGCSAATSGMVEGLVRRMSAELGGETTSCVATGGLADVIAPETTLIHHVDPDLTLHGLRIVWERNQ